MPSIKSALLAFLFLAPLVVHSSPVLPTSPAPVHIPWRTRNEPDSLLGRPYILQHPAGGAPVKENASPSTPRSYPLHPGAPSGRSARFAKYLVERAATGERIETPDGLVLDEGDAVTQVTQTSTTALPGAPPYQAYNTAVTLVPRPSGTAVVHAKAADKKGAGKNTKHAKTT
ncbi:hypothetical protein C8Q72DRAFT_884927 [Fomitopsis betulina]|nr:hypothetical protein C8Q72DRAFT_884927 [Fomitopsis betulina]